MFSVNRKIKEVYGELPAVVQILQWKYAHIFLLICEEMQNPSDFFESGKEWLDLVTVLWEKQQFLVLVVLYYLGCVSLKK